MRAVYFVERLQWDIPGNIFKHGIAIGDVDNDGDNELVVGTAEGELYIFKGTEIWYKTADLGMISCVAIGDIFNYGRNALVVVCGDGWVHIFYGPRSVNPNQSTTSQAENSKIEGSNADAKDSNDHQTAKIECVHLQRIPTNTKVILIADIDQDGANEMIIALTDRVVRSYRWSSNSNVGSGKLICLNKWESANQIGTITLQHTSDGIPALLVAQPGGTFMRIKCYPNPNKSDVTSKSKNETITNSVDYQTLGISRMRNPSISTEIIGNLEPGIREHSSSKSTNSNKNNTDNKDIKNQNPNNDPPTLKSSKETSLEFRHNYSQSELKNKILDDNSSKKDTSRSKKTTYESSRFHSQINSSEVDQVDGNVLGGNVILGNIEDKIKKSVLPSYKDFSKSLKKNIDKKDNKETIVNKNINCEIKKEKKMIQSKPYALATLDGTIMLVKDENILWAMQVDHQIFSLCRLDVTRDGSDEIVACAWDGQTYFLDQERRSVRFQFEEPVRSFCTGYYSLTSGSSTPSLVYSTFSNKIFLYYDVVLPSMVAKPFDLNDFITPEEKSFINELIGECSDTERDKKIQQFTEYLLYGMKIEHKNYHKIL